MKIFRTVEEFFKYYIEEEQSFLKVETEKQDLYIDIYNLCITNLDNVEYVFIIGSLYYYGKGIENDYDKALEFFLKAADMGFSRAANNLGIYYYDGVACERDTEKSFY